MAKFELMTKAITKVSLSDEDRNSLICVRELLDCITDKMDMVDEQYIIENLETGETIAYDELCTALMIIVRFLDENAGRDWKLV